MSDKKANAVDSNVSREAEDALEASDRLNEIESRMARIVEKLNKYIQGNGSSDKLKRRSKMWVKRLNLEDQ